MKLDDQENVMSNKVETLHVVAAPEGGWSVKRGGSSSAIATYRTKEEAVAAARKISQREGLELFIHGKDGKIQSKDSHGNDPYPPKG